MKRLNESGFTLVELLITCILISILAISMAAFLTDWVQNYETTNARTSLLDDAEQALDTVTNDIRLSGSADDNNRWPDPNGPSGNQYGWASGVNQLVLAKVATNTSGNVIFSDPNNYITLKDNEVYYLSGGNLYRRTIASGESGDAATTTCPPPGTSGCPADTLVASGVTSFNVTYYDASESQVDPASARSIGLAITLNKTVGGKNLTASYSTRMVFRND